MAWSIISSATGTNTATLGTHAAGDLILVFSYRDGSTTAPSLVSGFTNIVNGGANTNSARAAFKIAASSSETIGTWTNATSVIAVVIRNGMVGAFVQGGASSTTFNYPALTFLEDDGTSGAIGFIATRDGSSPASIDTAPSGMTYLTSVKDATDSAGCHYDLLATGWSSTNVATGVAATGWRSIVIGILDQELPANYFGYSTIGANDAGVNVDTTQAGTRFDVPEDCTIDEVWVYCKHFDANSVGKTCLYSTNSSGSPIVPNAVLDNGDTFNYNQFWAWRKSKGFTYSATAAEQLYPSVAFNDTWYTKYDTGGDTDQTYDKQNFAYASAFEDPSTSTDRNVADITQTIIVVYTPASADVNVDTGLGQVTYTGYEPTAAVTNNINVVTGLGEVTYNGFAPTIQTPRNVTTGLGVVSYTGYEPSVSVSNNINVQTDLGQVNYNGFAPSVSVSDNINVTTELGEVTFDGYSPTISIGNNIDVSTGLGEVQYNGFSPVVSISDNKNISTGLGEVSFNGYSPSVTATDNKNVLTGLGQVVYNGYEPNINISDNINIETQLGLVTFIGYEPLVSVAGPRRRFITTS